MMKIFGMILASIFIFVLVFGTVSAFTLIDKKVTSSYYYIKLVGIGDKITLKNGVELEFGNIEYEPVSKKLSPYIAVKSKDNPYLSAVILNTKGSIKIDSNTKLEMISFKLKYSTDLEKCGSNGYDSGVVYAHFKEGGYLLQAPSTCKDLFYLFDKYTSSEWQKSVDKTLFWTINSKTAYVILKITEIN